MIRNKNFLAYADELIHFFDSHGMNVHPRPQILLEKSGHSRLDVCAPTGNYDPETQTITLYFDGRHAKDVLRTFAHELVHHHQNLSDPEGFQTFSKSGMLDENPTLEKYEAEAFLKGNLLFRKWTESIR